MSLDNKKPPRYTKSLKPTYKEIRRTKEPVMLHKFLPREFNFFNLFEQQADYAVEAAKIFKEITTSTAIVDEATYQRIQGFEHRVAQKRSVA